MARTVRSSSAGAIDPPPVSALDDRGRLVGTGLIEQLGWAGPQPLTPEVSSLWVTLRPRQAGPQPVQASAGGVDN